MRICVKQLSCTFPSFRSPPPDTLSEPSSLSRRPAMPKLPRDSGAEAQRALERLGFSKLRQSGSDVVMRRHATGGVVPMHSELKFGTLAGLLRQADVTPEEFIEALGK